MFVFFYKKDEEESIKVKWIPVRIEILNHIIVSLNINISEEFNPKARKILIVSHQFVSNNIFLLMSRKYTNPLCGNIVSQYGLSNT